jgi:hypothetical protein
MRNTFRARRCIIHTTCAIRFFFVFYYCQVDFPLLTPIRLTSYITQRHESTYYTLFTRGTFLPDIIRNTVTHKNTEYRTRLTA